MLDIGVNLKFMRRLSLVLKVMDLPSSPLLITDAYVLLYYKTLLAVIFLVVKVLVRINFLKKTIQNISLLNENILVIVS